MNYLNIIISFKINYIQSFEKYKIDNILFKYFCSKENYSREQIRK